MSEIASSSGFGGFSGFAGIPALPRASHPSPTMVPVGGHPPLFMERLGALVFIPNVGACLGPLVGLA